MCKKELKIVPVNLGPYLNMEGLYYVDEEGNVYSKWQNEELKPLKPAISRKYGKDRKVLRYYRKITMYTPDKKRITRAVHRVVLESFSRAYNPQIFNYLNFDKFVVDHIDSNTENNKLSNLRWLSNFQNANVLRSDSAVNWSDELKDDICRLYFKEMKGVAITARELKKDTRNISYFLKGVIHKDYAKKWCKKNGFDYDKIMNIKEKKFPRQMKNILSDKESFEKRYSEYKKLKNRSK